ncbi:MAG: hypothetical protein IPL46_08315 [Saprospiraceae bacterium]|nr:hypothetical protein [Saprospiraceae bacterium]
MLFSKDDAYFQKGDERANLSNVALINEHGIGRQYLLSYYGLAGPVYPVMQYLWLPISQMKPNLVRLLNMLALLAVIYLMGASVGSFETPWLVMSVPMTYLCSGYAMTIIPSLLFLVPSYLLATKDYHQRFGLFGSLASGLLLSLAILTRLNLLLLLPLWLMLPFVNSGKINLKSIKQSFFLGVGSIPLLVWVFETWGGFVPPIAAVTIGNSALGILSNFSFTHVLLSIGVTALIYAVINRQWFCALSRTSRNYLIWPVLVLLTVNYIFNILNYLPMQVLLSRLNLNEVTSYLLGSLMGSTLIILTVYFLWSFITRYVTTLDTGYRSASWAIVIILIGSGLVSDLFSSRYAFQAIPFIFLTAGISRMPDNISTLLRIAGVFLGFVIYFAFRNYQPVAQISF